jgi:penicillin-binding protein 1A
MAEELPNPPPPGAPGPAPEPRLVLEGLPPARPLWVRVAKWGAFAAVATALLAAAGAVGLWLHFSRGLPSIPSLEEYRPPVVTEVVSADGQLAGEFFVERRKVVPYERIPRRLIQAFVASEDQTFFEHRGIDLLGTLRAAVNTYVLRRRIQGGSTITQQTAKSLLVSAEGFEEGTRRNLRRKIRELILATRLESAFTKEEILYLYLNGVYLGHHSYGVQAAAENYFRKNVEDLSLAEAALVAGLPQAPTRYSPFSNPDSARSRRRYVLRRMFEDGYITAAERKAAEEAEVRVYPVDDVFRETAPFYVEQVRRQVVERYGNDRLLRDGLRVETAMNLETQRGAQAAMLQGLMEVDHRQGYYGPVLKVAGAERTELLARLSRAWPRGSLATGDYAVGVVTQVDDRDGLARVAVGEETGLLPISGMRWARRPNPEAYYPDALISRVSTALSPGDVVLVRRVERRQLVERELSRSPEAARHVPEAPLLLALEQEPRLQGALVSVEPFTGYVAAMVGGYDFDASEFNRAFQACRQPGSAFKPVVYSGAFEKLNFTPATLLTDAPIVYRDEESGVSWKPENFGSSFKGDVTVRDALVHSLNIPAVKVAAALGVDTLVAWAKQLGITTPVKRELGSAIGSSCTTLWDLANVYCLLDRYGERKQLTFVKRVLDRDGRLLEDHSAPSDPFVPLSTRLAAAAAAVQAPGERVMDERSAFITVHLLHEVATVGTGAQAARLGKPAAGKTGTTNDSFDTWFLGFTRDLFTGVWLGYDRNETPLARYETGGRAALPIWLSTMQAALRDRPQPDFPVPDGIAFVRIDPKDGTPTDSLDQGVVEPFKVENQPVAEAAGKPKVEVRDLFSE